MFQSGYGFHSLSLFHGMRNIGWWVYFTPLYQMVCEPENMQFWKSTNKNAWTVVLLIPHLFSPTFLWSLSSKVFTIKFLGLVTWHRDHFPCGLARSTVDKPSYLVMLIKNMLYIIYTFCRGVDFSKGMGCKGWRQGRNHCTVTRHQVSGRPNKWRRACELREAWRDILVCPPIL